MFHGIQPRRYRDVLDCLHASVHQYPRNTHLVELGEQSHNTGILLDGTVEEFLYDENGNQVSICRLASGQIFGAELACTGWSTSRSACGPTQTVRCSGWISALSCPSRP